MQIGGFEQYQMGQISSGSSHDIAQGLKAAIPGGTASRDRESLASTSGGDRWHPPDARRPSIRIADPGSYSTEIARRALICALTALRCRSARSNSCLAISGLQKASNSSRREWARAPGSIAQGRYQRDDRDHMVTSCAKRHLESRMPPSNSTLRLRTSKNEIGLLAPGKWGNASPRACLDKMFRSE